MLDKLAFLLNSRGEVAHERVGVRCRLDHLARMRLGHAAEFHQLCGKLGVAAREGGSSRLECES